ncbi:PEP-CTERM sorting domain-containing protein [Bowmanella dokdonensis]|uniref:PEP-CTERM sorting domain-containing protein n=1 Tax=Bowmanella dokdonensis TaxID=751969 RepID=A0A939DLT3_9ALTE|nr:PEP-CTERM sorting domain-containing protein [Bowmanella dokdonensis]MBN7825109.1 PEP-CTERM sorting domain-containing protein [Bowmanella dokdonensis]
MLYRRVRNLASVVAAGALLVTFSSNATLINPGFEEGSLSGWSSSGSVSVTSSANLDAGTVSPFEGSFMAELVSAATSASELAAIMGVSEATLEATNAGVNATNGSLLYQSTSAQAGDSFTFNWNFVEQDYLPYDDWAFYGIRLGNGATELFKFASLGTVGPGNGSTINGWEALTVNIDVTGDYTFYFGIVNALDTSLDSRLFIDGITGTGTLDPNPVPAPATIALLGLGLLAMRLRNAR